MQKHDRPGKTRRDGSVTLAAVAEERPQDRRDPGPARGILRHAPAAGNFHHVRIAPEPLLADLVQHFWIVRWDLRGLPAQTRQTLPHPNVHLVMQPGRSLIHGIHSGCFSRTLAGRDGVFGIKFRPGGFRPFLGRPVSELRDRSLPPVDLFGAAVMTFERQLFEQSDDAGMIAVAERFLRDCLPKPDPEALRAGVIVDSIAEQRGLTRVEQVQEHFGLNARALQRLFHDYVGIGAKWVINRYRLHEAVERMAAGTPADWAQLALELGYFDQAHFIRDFKAMTGHTPGRYANDERPAANVDGPGSS